MTFCAHRAERADTVVGGPADVVAQRAGDPFGEELVIVPARGGSEAAGVLKQLGHRLAASVRREGGEPPVRRGAADGWTVWFLRFAAALYVGPAGHHQMISKLRFAAHLNQWVGQASQLNVWMSWLGREICRYLQIGWMGLVRMFGWPAVPSCMASACQLRRSASPSANEAPSSTSRLRGPGTFSWGPWITSGTAPWEAVGRESAISQSAGGMNPAR